MKFYQHESAAGASLPRRHDWLKKTLIPFSLGGGLKKDIDNMYYLSENMLGRTFCPLGDAAGDADHGVQSRSSERVEDHLGRQGLSVWKAGQLSR